MVQHILDELWNVIDGKVSEEAFEIISEELVTILGNYEISKKTTELAGYSNTNIAFMNMYLAWKKTEGKSENTLEAYAFQLKKLIDSIQKPLEDVTENDIFLYLARFKKERKASNSYMNTVRLYLSSFFSWLADKEYIKKNPVKGIHPVKMQKKIPKTFTEEELESMRQAPRCARDKAIIEVLYSTGVRVEELSELDIDDININSKTVRVRQGKGNKERYTFISAQALMYLKKYLNERDDLNPALFISKKRPYGRLSKDGIEDIVNKVAMAAGVKDAHPHKFRRTMATNLLKKGMPLEKVSRILGHQDLQTTMIYCAVDNKDVQYDYEKYMAL